MNLQLISSVKTPLVREVLWTYKEAYYIGDRTGRTFRTCGCGPETGTHPNNFTKIDDLVIPAVCEACQWTATQKALQQRVVMDGLSMMIPRTKPMPLPKLSPGIHPFDSEVLEADRSKDPGSVTGRVASWLVSKPLQHIVFYVHHSQVIDLMYARREQEITDVIQLAPVLVYWHNHDNRQNGNDRVKNMILARGQGITYALSKGVPNGR